MLRRHSAAVTERQSILDLLDKVSYKNFTHNYDEITETVPLYIIVINKHAQNITIKWLIELLRKSQSDGGGEFLLKRLEILLDSDDPIMIEIGSSSRRINSAAHAIELKQLTNDGSAAKIFFARESILDSNTSLSHSEKQKTMLHEIESLHTQETGVLFGYPNVKMYPGQSIFQVCQRENVIEEYFPLHNDKQLEELRMKWCFSLKKQPIHSVRNYFGETIAFYFAFLEFYTNALIVPGILGVLQFLFLNEMNPFCAIFNMIWVIIFLKSWKRKSNELAHHWGTIGDVLLEGPRPTFRGKHMTVDHITGHKIPVYPIYKTWIKEYGISLPIVFVCLYIAFYIMLLYFQIESDLINYYAENPSKIASIVTLIPSVIYALTVMLMNKIYQKLATKLNEFENHRTQISHENHLIIKLVLFEFVNNFMSVFYVAFYYKDLQMLKWQIGTMLIVNQIVDNIQEVLVPIVIAYRLNKSFEEKRKKLDIPSDISKILREKSMMQYDGTYYDYLELFIQFGYVFLFSSVFPLAPLFACINNLIEIRSDATKLCYAYKRPHQRSANSINGGWMKTFEVMGLISVITNCALLSMSPSVNALLAQYEIEGVQSFMYFVALEHIVLSIILVIAYVVPDVPKHVNIALMKQQYENRKYKLLSARSLSRAK